MSQFQNLLPVQHHDRQNRAELDDDLEALEKLRSRRVAARDSRESGARSTRSGRNSVTPSTMPRMSAWNETTRGRCGRSVWRGSRGRGRRSLVARRSTVDGRASAYSIERSRTRRRSSSSEKRSRASAAASVLIALPAVAIVEQSAIAASAIASTSPTSQRKPVSPSRTTSGSPPAFEPIDRNAGRERLERAQAERLAARRQQKEVGAGEQRRDRRRSCRGRTRCR